jgi:hypothetical protein
MNNVVCTHESIIVHHCMKSSFFTLSYPCRNLSFTPPRKPFFRSRPFPAIHSPPFVRLSHGEDDRRRNLANVPLTRNDRTRRSSSSMSQPSPSSKMTTETGYVTLDSAQLFTKTWIVPFPLRSRARVNRIARNRSDCPSPVRAWIQ